MESKEHGKQAEICLIEADVRIFGSQKNRIIDAMESYASIKVAEAVEPKDKEIAELKAQLEQAKKENETFVKEVFDINGYDGTFGLEMKKLIPYIPGEMRDGWHKRILKALEIGSSSVSVSTEKKVD